MTAIVPRLSMICLAMVLATSSQAATTYICQVDGKAAFSTVKVDASCKASSMDGISTEVAPEKLAELTPENEKPNENDTLNQKKTKELLSSYDDVVIMPKAAEMVTNSATASRSLRAQTAQAPIPKLEIKLRKQPPLNTAQATVNQRNRKAAPVRTVAPIRTPVAAIAYAPPPKPQFTRQQILQREISNENVALTRTKAQLEAARKKGGNTTALLQAVRDREANIRAIQGEMNKM